MGGDTMEKRALQETTNRPYDVYNTGLGAHMSPGSSNFVDMHDVHYAPGAGNVAATVHIPPANYEGFETAPTAQKQGSLNLRKRTRKLVSGRTRSTSRATRPTSPWQTTGREILCWISRGIWLSRWPHRTETPLEPVIHRLGVLELLTRSTRLWIKSTRPWTGQKTTTATQPSDRPPETMVHKEELCSYRNPKKAFQGSQVMQNPLHCR